MDVINDISFIYKITTDERWEKGRKFGKADTEKLQKAKEEWHEVFRPVTKFFTRISDDEQVVVDLFFDDYEPIKERILDRGAEIMSIFGEVTKKIDEKLQK